MGSATTSALSVSQGTAKIYYRVDGGSWVELAGISVRSLNGNPDPASESGPWSAQVTGGMDMSDIEVRAECDGEISGTYGELDLDADITNWWIETVEAGGVMQA